MRGRRRTTCRTFLLNIFLSLWEEVKEVERRENMCTMRERAEDRRLTEDSIVFLRLKQNISLRNVSSFVITFDFTDFPVPMTTTSVV